MDFFFSGLTFSGGALVGIAKASPMEKVMQRRRPHFACRVHTLIMESTRRIAYDTAFKLKALDLAIQEGKTAAARNIGVDA